MDFIELHLITSKHIAFKYIAWHRHCKFCQDGCWQCHQSSWRIGKENLPSSFIICPFGVSGEWEQWQLDLFSGGPIHSVQSGGGRAGGKKSENVKCKRFYDHDCYQLCCHIFNCIQVKTSKLVAKKFVEKECSQANISHSLQPKRGCEPLPYFVSPKRYFLKKCANIWLPRFEVFLLNYNDLRDLNSSS